MKFHRASVACAILATVLLAVRCSAQEPPSEQKFDVLLRQRIAQAEARNDRTPIAFLGRCLHSIDADLRTRLERAGIRIETTTGDIFTAIGAPSQIRQLAGDPEIVSLNLSAERPAVH